MLIVWHFSSSAKFWMKPKRYFYSYKTSWSGYYILFKLEHFPYYEHVNFEMSSSRNNISFRITFDLIIGDIARLVIVEFALFGSNASICINFGWDVLLLFLVYFNFCAKIAQLAQKLEYSISIKYQLYLKSRKIDAFKQNTCILITYTERKME